MTSIGSSTTHKLSMNGGSSKQRKGGNLSPAITPPLSRNFSTNSLKSMGGGKSGMGSKKNSSSNLAYITDDTESKGDILPPMGSGSIESSPANLAKLKLMDTEESSSVQQWFEDKVGKLVGKGRSNSGGSGADMFLNMNGSGASAAADPSANATLAIDIASAISVIGVVKSFNTYKVLRSIKENLAINTLVNNTTNSNADDTSRDDRHGDNALNTELLKKVSEMVREQERKGNWVRIAELA